MTRSSKRPHTNNLRSDEFIDAFGARSRQDRTNHPTQSQFCQHVSAPLEYASEYADQGSKRSRTSTLSGRDNYDQDPRFSQRTYLQQQGSFGTFGGLNQTASTQNGNYGQAPLTSPTAMSEFTFRYQGPDSSSSPPYTSPNVQVPVYNPVQNMSYQQQPRYSSQGYLPNQGPISQSAQLTSLNGSQYGTVDQSSSLARSYNGLSNSENGSYNISTSSRHRPSLSRDNYSQYGLDQYRQNSFTGSVPNLLPPLHSTMSSIPSAPTATSSYSNYITPDSRNLVPDTTSIDQQRTDESFANYTQNGTVLSREMARETS